MKASSQYLHWAPCYVRPSPPFRKKKTGGGHQYTGHSCVIIFDFHYNGLVRRKNKRGEGGEKTFPRRLVTRLRPITWENLGHPGYRVLPGNACVEGYPSSKHETAVTKMDALKSDSHLQLKCIKSVMIYSSKYERRKRIAYVSVEPYII